MRVDLLHIHLSGDTIRYTLAIKRRCFSGLGDTNYISPRSAYRPYIRADYLRPSRDTIRYTLAIKRRFFRGTISLVSNSGWARPAKKGVIAMRVSRWAFSLLAASSAAAADKIPHLKAGEWQIVRLGNENDIP